MDGTLPISSFFVILHLTCFCLQSILGSTDNVGSVIRSVKDESFLQTGQLHQRAARICRERGLEAPSPEVLSLLSHAAQERVKTLVSKLSVIAEHRLDIIKTEGIFGFLFFKIT